MTVLHSTAPDGAAAATAAAAAAGPHVAHLLLRRRASTAQPREIRVAVIGNVDSGKSTMVGVLTRSMLDDGRGAARSKVFKHDHEGATGRTSAIGQHNLCLASSGAVLNDSMFKNSTCADYVSRSSKVVTLVDLAGHERYFKTTAYGLTGALAPASAFILPDLSLVSFSWRLWTLRGMSATSRRRLTASPVRWALPSLSAYLICRQCRLFYSPSHDQNVVNSG